MKKMLIVTLTVASLMIFSGAAFAGNAVSQKATAIGGTAVAQCAQMMPRGISALATGVCPHM